MANYSNQHVAGGPVLQGGEGHGAPAVLVSQLPTPQVGLWECYPPLLLGRVVLGGDREQLLLPGLLVKAGSSWRLHWDQLKTVPEQAESCTAEKGESFPEHSAAAAATHVSRAQPSMG